MRIDGPFPTPAVALTIAGSDNSAGAGIQADLKTFSHFQVYGLTAITCVVAEVPGLVTAIQPIESQIVAEQIALSLAHFPIGAIKTGMLYSAEIVDAVAKILEAQKERGRAIPLVVDPVMVATSGDVLLQDTAIETYRRHLLPMATLVTPNLEEAAVLIGKKRIESIAEMEAAGRQLSADYRTAFLMKGGHLAGEAAVDLLVSGTEVWQFSAPFVRDVPTHGTGCTYSAAIAANLALGLPLPEAVGRAKKYISAAIGQSFLWQKTGGTPVMALNHFAQRADC